MRITPYQVFSCPCPCPCPIQPEFEIVPRVFNGLSRNSGTGKGTGTISTRKQQQSVYAQQTPSRLSSPFWQRLGLSILALVLFAGCSGNRQKKVKLPVGIVLKKDLSALADLNKTRTVFRARYNPALCKCPKTEIYVGKRWLRVILEPDDPDQNFVAAYRKRAETDRRGGLFREYRFTGTLESDVKPMSSRLYLVFTMRQFQPGR